jgi:hypothetical protein
MNWTQWIQIGAMAQCLNTALLASVIILLAAGDMSPTRLFRRNCLLLAVVFFGLCTLALAVL